MIAAVDASELPPGRLPTIWALSMILLGCGRPVPPEGPPPFPPSPVICAVEFDWGTHDERASGSDNWPITWSDDDHQYTTWGDGGGFGGTNRDGRVSLGIARIEGTATDYRGYNVSGGVDPESAHLLTGKSRGIVSVGGVLYMWRGPGSNVRAYRATQLLMSQDKGRSWSESSWDFTDVDDRLVLPGILNFGKDNAGARDRYVYHYFIRKETAGKELEIHFGGSPPTGKIDLLRVPSDQLMDRDAYESFAGIDDSGRPIWTSRHQDRRPVFEDPNGVGFSVSVSHNAGLQRYLLMTEHSRSFEGRLGIFDAPEPWGPWTTVAYYQSPGFGRPPQGSTSFYWNFSNKWLSVDGLDFTLLFTGIGGDDSWNTVRGRFEVCQADDPEQAPAH